MGRMSQEEINTSLFDEVKRLKELSARQHEIFTVLSAHPLPFWIAKFLPPDNRAKVLAFITRQNVADWHDILYSDS